MIDRNHFRGFESDIKTRTIWAYSRPELNLRPNRLLLIIDIKCPKRKLKEMEKKMKAEFMILWEKIKKKVIYIPCLLYTSPSPRD